VLLNDPKRPWKVQSLAAEAAISLGQVSNVKSLLEDREWLTGRIAGFWLIGREIVLEIQGGDDRAEYGKQVIENLSERLTRRYGKGFSALILWKFRQFYQVDTSRKPRILSPAGREFKSPHQFHASDREAILSPHGIELKTTEKSYSTSSEFRTVLHWVLLVSERSGKCQKGHCWIRSRFSPQRPTIWRPPSMNACR
jgi:hypothetical protein